MMPILAALHLIASGLALVSGGLALSGRGFGSVPGRLGLVYVGSVTVMSVSSFGLFRETGSFHALHGVALGLMVIVMPAGWAMVQCPRDPTIFPRHRRTLFGVYLVLLVSTVLETGRRVVAPVLAARGFEAWEAYWIGLGLMAAGVLWIGLRHRTPRPRPSRVDDTKA